MQVLDETTSLPPTLTLLTPQTYSLKRKEKKKKEKKEEKKAVRIVLFW